MIDEMNVEILDCNDGKGRGLFAKKDFEFGDVILHEEPLALTVYRQERRNYCNWSLKRPCPGVPLKRCSRTKEVYFLNKQELKRAWERGYKEECSALDRLLKHRKKDETIPDEILLASRIIWAIRKGGEKVKAEVARLCDDWDMKTEDEKKPFLDAAFLLSIIVDGNVQDKCVSYYARLFVKLQRNAFEIQGPALNRIGIGIYTKYACYINHSFESNAAVAFAEYGRLTLIAGKSIRTGEEILTSYTATEQSKIAQILQLQAKYGIDYQGLGSLSRPFLFNFCFEDLAKEINVYELNDLDEGEDFQIYDQNEHSINVYLRKNSPFANRSTLWPIIKTYYSPCVLPEFSEAHSLNLGKCISGRIRKDLLKEFEESMLPKFPLLWILKALYLAENSDVEEQDLALDSIKNLKSYLGSTGDEGRVMLNMLFEKAGKSFDLPT